MTLALLQSCAHSLPDYTAGLSSRLPTNGETEAIGEYSLGCLSGAQTFNGDEKGLVLSQIKRGRYWGHPDLIKLLTKAGVEFHKQNLKLIIGDLSQSRGGPTIDGHNSHQTGLDVDVWFKMPASSEKLSLHTLETEEMKPISQLGSEQIKLIQFFAGDKSVERIFINPAFKKKLCIEKSLSDEDQHKLRAWWGHDDHIHVRLHCPENSPKCLAQKPIPAGDGCGEELNWWFTEDANSGGADSTWKEMKAVYLEKVHKLPVECSFYKE